MSSGWASAATGPSSGVRRRWARHRVRVLQTAAATTSGLSYRVEHRVGRQVVANLGWLHGASGHHATLSPFVSALRLSGVTEGKVVLLEAESGEVVARRSVTPVGERAA